MKAKLAVVCVVGIAGCAGIDTTVPDRFRGPLSEVAERQVIGNIIRLSESRLAIPTQIELTNSQGTVGGSSTLGLASPGLNFRGIAITGMTVGGTASAQQVLGQEPITDFLKIRRLQIFYSYVLGDFNNISDNLEDSFSRFEKSVFLAGNPGYVGEVPLPFRISSVLGVLPTGPLAQRASDSGCATGYDLISVPNERVCVRNSTSRTFGNTPGNQNLNARDLLNLLALWSVAIPQLGDPPPAGSALAATQAQAAAAQPGAPSARQPASPGSLPRSGQGNMPNVPRTAPAQEEPRGPERSLQQNFIPQGSVPRDARRQSIIIPPPLGLGN